MQALSNSEEEKKGVAAALLAPLLPDVVKEEEERWRRKVICKEEVEPPPEEEAKAEEAAAVAAAAAAAPEEPEAGRDPLEDTLQEELCSVVQSGESGEEEEEQDTLELEMVLERKKVREVLCHVNEAANKAAGAAKSQLGKTQEQQMLASLPEPFGRGPSSAPAAPGRAPCRAGRSMSCGCVQLLPWQPWSCCSVLAVVNAAP